MKVLFVLLIMLVTINLFSVHNFTINDQENISISIGDSVELRFEYEEIGSSATCEIQIQISTFDFPVIEPENMVFVDGGSLDETGEDGVFLYSFENFAQFPQSSSVIIKLTDNEVSDEITVGFQPISSNYTISGQILKEGIYLYLPVRGAFVYSFYNADRDELQDIFENPTTEDFFDYMLEDRYFLSVLSNDSGEYSISVPDTIENIPCTVDVMSSLDTNNEKVSPATIELLVDGNEEDVDLIYLNPDGIFSGVIENIYTDSIPNATIIINKADSSNTSFSFSDSVGSFEIPLLNGDYYNKVLKSGYQVYSDSFTIADGDINQTIVLTEQVTELAAPENLQLQIINDSIQIFWNSVENADFYEIYSSDDPYDNSIQWDLEETVNDSTAWVRALNTDEKRMFYFIKAVKE